jgi:hypothetical protein
MEFEVAVIDPGERTVVYETLCYFPVVAPDGKHIAFEMWYPSYGMAAWPEVRVIDTDGAEQGPIRVYPAHGMPQGFAEDRSSPAPVYRVVSEKVWSVDGPYWISWARRKFVFRRRIGKCSRTGPPFGGVHPPSDRAR